MSTLIEPLVGRRCDIGGRKLAIHRAGVGEPAVVFVPGAGLIGADFLNIHTAVAKFAPSVIYDRGGTGWSDPVRLPRSAAEAADELRALLEVAGVAPPYVLVGHSLGGAYIRRYAQRHPAEIAGLVFLDPAHEGYASMPAQPLLGQVRQALRMARALVNVRGFYRPMFARMFATWPDGVRERLVDYHVRNWRKSLAEASNLQSEVLPEIAGGGPTPDVPLIVLTAMGIDPFMAPFMDAAFLRDLNARKAAVYGAFAGSTRRGENRLIEGAGHSTLHTERPDAVIAAIRDVLAAAAETRRAA